MNIAICDDNINDTELICALLNEHFDKNGFVGHLHTFINGEDLADSFKTHKFDAVFLDIYMNGMDGIKTAEKLREIDSEFALVFITSSYDHAMQSYSVYANSYVPKPIERKDIERAFAQCRRTFIKNGKFIEVVFNRRKIKIPLIKILFIEVYGREVLLHTTSKKIDSYLKVEDSPPHLYDSGSEAELPIGGFDAVDFPIKTTTPLDELEKVVGSSFLRCHRSYIINLNHVLEMLPNDFKMRDGSLIPMRQRGRSELRDIYADFISDKLFEVTI